jgi:hypothetical protein
MSLHPGIEPLGSDAISYPAIGSSQSNRVRPGHNARHDVFERLRLQSVFAVIACEDQNGSDLNCGRGVVS